MRILALYINSAIKKKPTNFETISVINKLKLA